MNRHDRRRRNKVGDITHIHYARSAEGVYWVKGATSNPDDLPADAELHGPFSTEAEAQADSERTLFGPDCKVREGGQWDPAWERKQ